MSCNHRKIVGSNAEHRSDFSVERCQKMQFCTFPKINLLTSCVAKPSTADVKKVCHWLSPTSCVVYVQTSEGLGLTRAGGSVRYIRADFRFAPTQWEMSLQSNGVSHWLGANLNSVLYMTFEIGCPELLENSLPCDDAWGISGLILGLSPAKERRRYKVMASLIGWAQT